MSRLFVITTPDLAAGYRLAGVETLIAADADAAQQLLRELMAGDQASLIVVRQDLLQKIDYRLQRQIETSNRPVVVTIPSGRSAAAAESHRRYISEMIRRAIGFHITLGAENGESRPIPAGEQT